ncbi:MAG: ribonuclease P protein component [Chloroflexi bacterium]|nr:ribonuclease P protein component [Chloroflexota bacterium]
MSKFGRLRKGRDFRRVRAVRNVSYFKPMIVYQSPGVEGESRLGVVAGSRLGGAVVRNRAKRRIRSAWRLEIGASAEPRDMVIVARSPATKVPHAALRSAIQRAIRRSPDARK